MTKINKNHGGSYVVENGKTKKVEGTQEPKVAAPRDAKGVRLDRDPADKSSNSEPGRVRQGQVAARVNTRRGSDHVAGDVPPSTNKGVKK